MHSDVLGNQLQIEDHARLLKKVSLRDKRFDTTRLSRILNQLHDAFGRRTGTASLLGLEKWLRRYDMLDGRMDQAVTTEQLQRGLRQCGILSLGDDDYRVLEAAFEHPVHDGIAYLAFIDAVCGDLTPRRHGAIKLVWSQLLHHYSLDSFAVDGGAC